MHNQQRAAQQVALWEATIIALRAGFPNLDPAREQLIAAQLVVAARLEEFCEDFTENIHRAGEGI